ncbi:MAG: CPBP family intramembrane metalloprotease [Bacteroidales bacterium]|nr:CPBP family intramembrane metalloprotease [Bacteroidales bacterium]
MKYNIFATNFKTKLLTFLLVEAVMFIVASAMITIASKLLALPERPQMMIMLAIQGFVLFVASPLITARLITTQPFKYLSLTTLPTLKQIVWVTIAMVVMTPALNLIVSWNEGMHLPEFMSSIEEWMRANEDSAMEATKKLLSINTIGSLITTVLLVGALTGVGEELTFRGIIQKLISEKWSNPHIAIWVTAILFSAIHLQFFGFFPRMLLGAFFGYLLIWSRSIWLPIYAHFLNNSMAVVAAYMLNINLTTDEYEKVGTVDNGTIWMALVSLILFAGCVYKIKGKRVESC